MLRDVRGLTKSRISHEPEITDQRQRVTIERFIGDSVSDTQVKRGTIERFIGDSVSDTQVKRGTIERFIGDSVSDTQVKKEREERKVGSSASLHTVQPIVVSLPLCFSYCFGTIHPTVWSYGLGVSCPHQCVYIYIYIYRGGHQWHR